MSRITSTRQRLLDEGMRLFSANGYEATSVSQIESAAGLSPGSGAMYNHFASKDALLQAGVDRLLDHRNAMGKVRAVFAGLGDLRAELTAMGRYLLAALDEQTELLQIAARIPPGLSKRLDTAYSALLGGLKAELAEWIRTWAPTQTPQQCKALATVGFNALLGARVEKSLFYQTDADLTDNDYIAEWTATLTSRIEGMA